jgi:hypothetical protein
MPSRALSQMRSTHTLWTSGFREPACFSRTTTARWNLTARYRSQMRRPHSASKSRYHARTLCLVHALFVGKKKEAEVCVCSCVACPVECEMQLMFNIPILKPKVPLTGKLVLTRGDGGLFTSSVPPTPLFVSQTYTLHPKN